MTNIVCVWCAQIWLVGTTNMTNMANRSQKGQNASSDNDGQFVCSQILQEASGLVFALFDFGQVVSKN